MCVPLAVQPSVATGKPALALERWISPPSRMRHQKSLVIDALNQINGPFLRRKTHGINQWLSERADVLVRVLRLAKRYELRPVCVVDASWKSNEVQQKWISRREREMRSGTRQIPLNADTLISELIARSGTPLIYDKRFDGDDVVASYALQSHCESIVLSADSDFHRYDDGALTHRVFWAKLSGKANDSLQPNIYKKKSPHMLTSIEGYDSVFVEGASELLHGKLAQGDGQVQSFVRGTTYPLAERQHARGSLHLAARPFRAALYTCPVRERFPIWDGTAVQWIDEVVQPAEAGMNWADFESRSIAKELLCRVGGPTDEGHQETALLYACELAAHGRQSSMLVELELALGRRFVWRGNAFSWETLVSHSGGDGDVCDATRPPSPPATAV